MLSLRSCLSTSPNNKAHGRTYAWASEWAVVCASVTRDVHVSQQMDRLLRERSRTGRKRYEEILYVQQRLLLLVSITKKKKKEKNKNKKEDEDSNKLTK